MSPVSSQESMRQTWTCNFRDSSQSQAQKLEIPALSLDDIKLDLPADQLDEVMSQGSRNRLESARNSILSFYDEESRSNSQ